MNERVDEAPRLDLASDRPDRISGAGRLIILAFGLVGVAIGFVLIEGEGMEPLMLGLLAMLAIVGVAMLLLLALGLIRIGGRKPGVDIARGYLDTLGEGVMLVDDAGHILYANHSYAELTGAGRDGEVRAVERLFASDAKAAEAIYRVAQAVRDGKGAEEEVRLPAPLSGARGGGARWYRIRARPVSTTTGVRAVAAWTVADVTGERAQQESVFQELQHAIDYLDHAPAGFFSAEPDGRIVYLNATLAEWLGIDLAQFETGSLTLRDLVRGESVALLAGVLAERGHDRTETIDLDLVKRNGQSLPVRLLHRVPVAAGGAPVATRTIVLNRSPGEEGSEALRAAEVRFTRFFNNTPIAIAAIDRNGTIGRTNAAFLRLFKGAFAGWTGRRRLVDLVVEADRETIAAAIESAVRRPGVIPPIDVAIIGEGERSTRFYINAVEDSADGRDAVIVNAIEITDQRVLEQQLSQRHKLETVGRLAGGIAHDFNNLLTAIIGFSDLLLANHRPSDPSFQDIMNIKQNANRAAGLVRQLLAFSRRQTLRPQVLQLGDLISDLSALLGRLLGENVKLEVIPGSDLWPIKADLNQFEQVIVNLAVNARDAMPSGGTMTIRTRNLTAADVSGYPYRPLPATDYVLLEIEDTGSGIPPEVQGRIFEHFFSTKEVGKGTGLGLSTVYGIVKQTEAFIYFDSTMGKGTVFRIFIPRYVAPEGEKAAAVVEEPKISDLTGSATILLVEDEEAVRSFAARALASRGYKVYEAASGIEALEVMEEAGGKIDLVVSDVVMPELDGPSLLRELRKTRPELKIIFISGYAEEAFKKNLPEGEAFHFLPKPFSLKQLAIAVKETLGR
jgi:two-component system cell cycle sensor histidine kinase/response regulator CckA